VTLETRDVYAYVRLCGRPNEVSDCKVTLETREVYAYVKHLSKNNAF